MKKILLPLACLLCLKAAATTWPVNVSNFQFSSANLNVKVGDVIHWVWVSGFHTTSSVTVPSGALPGMRRSLHQVPHSITQLLR